MKYATAILSGLLLAVNAQKSLFIEGPAFSNLRKATIAVECPEIGPSGSRLTIDHTADGAGAFPALAWSSELQDAAEYLLVSEDPDAPLPKPIVHGVYYAIPPEMAGINGADLESSGSHTVSGGFKYGQNRGGNVYLPPAPMEGHGPHRYFFEVVALNQKVDQGSLSAAATVEELSREIEGKVIGWGFWMGVYSR